MVKIITILLMFILVSCGLTPQGNLFRNTVAGEGKEAAAKGLENAEWYICRFSSVGAVQDRYGRNENLASSWATICGVSDNKLWTNPK